MDESQAVITRMFNLLTGSQDLKNIMQTAASEFVSGSPTLATGQLASLHHVWAPPDAEFPYLVHRLGTNNSEPPIIPGVYYLDIWDYADTSHRVWAIRNQIASLIAEAPPYTGNGVTGLRLYKGIEMFIPEDTEGIWHYSMMMQARFGIGGDL